ncbi:GGDEF domain-containing protein [Metabacillus herbersteinensis]|uniref:GGDEF domain-containing protein n=1 Tax=Metabacillus herbersteinensis TaxID=283816 RepID=A0ABV6GAZ8_9BACI
MNVFQGMFANIAIVIAFIFLGNQFVREKSLSPRTDLKTKIALGLLLGILGLILMTYQVPITDVMFIDLRYLPIVIAAIYTGFLSSVLSSLCIAFGRLFMFGVSDTSIKSFVFLLLLGLLIGILSKMIQNQSFFRKWFLLNVISLVFAILNFCILQITWVFLAYYLIAYIIAASLIYYCLVYVSQLNGQYRYFKTQSMKDHLTGLYNHRKFAELIAEEKANALEQSDQPLSLLVIDIDHFKKVNDTYGHLFGDQVLHNLSKLLVSSIRKEDKVSRYGGEEFTVILPNTTIGEASSVAESIRRFIETEIFFIEQKELSITVSIGVASYPETVTDVHTLFEKADENLYKSKTSGRNKVSI